MRPARAAGEEPGREDADRSYHTFASAVHPGARVCGGAFRIRRVSCRPSAPIPRRSPGPAPRETEVARLVLAGPSNQRIADTLHVSARTVKFHVLHVFLEAGVHRRAGLISLWTGPAAAATGQ